MIAVGYVRVSTERQADQGVSLEAQEAKVRRFSYPTNSVQPANTPRYWNLARWDPRALTFSLMGLLR